MADIVVSKAQRIIFRICFWIMIVFCTGILLVGILSHYSHKAGANDNYVARYQTIADRIEGEIQKIDLDIDMDLQALNYVDEIKRINYWAMMIDTATNSTDLKTLMLAHTLKEKVSKIQEQELPRMRKRYLKDLAEVLWKTDVYVRANTENTVLDLSGDVFAMNDKVDEMKKAIIFSAHALRYRRVDLRQAQNLPVRAMMNTVAGPDNEVSSDLDNIDRMTYEFRFRSSYDD